MARTHSKGLFRPTRYYCMFQFSIRGGGDFHKLERNDFSFGDEPEYGKFVASHERPSKNGKATMSRFQPEHFRPAVKVYEPDVVETFERYFPHLREGMAEFFLGVIDNLRTPAWYLSSPMGERPLSLLVKGILEENGLNIDEYTNKSDRTTLVTRIGHHSEKAYSKYDRSKEAKVRATQRCATNTSMTYNNALQEETAKLKETMIDGIVEESPAKRLKSLEESDVSSRRDSIALQFTNSRLVIVEIGNSPVQAVSGPPDGQTTKNLKGKRARKLEDIEDTADWEWMNHFDWDSDLKVWEEGKLVAINPISGFLGKLVNFDGITINFRGNANFRN